jgi:hypothetical protein
LKAAGFRIQGTRLDIYRKTFATINKFITENREEELVKKLPSFTFINDIYESQELIEACDEFPDLTQPGLRQPKFPKECPRAISRRKYETSSEGGI